MQFLLSRIGHILYYMTVYMYIISVTCIWIWKCMNYNSHILHSNRHAILHSDGNLNHPVALLYNKVCLFLFHWHHGNVQVLKLHYLINCKVFDQFMWMIIQVCIVVCHFMSNIVSVKQNTYQLLIPRSPLFFPKFKYDYDIYGSDETVIMMLKTHWQIKWSVLKKILFKGIYRKR